MQISQLLLFCRRRHIGKVIQGNPIGSVSDTIDYKPYNLEAMFTTSITICMLGVKVRNMKMDFNTGGTWRRHQVPPVR